MGLKTVPVVFEPATDPIGLERSLIHQNKHRPKTKEQIAREFKRLEELETMEASKRKQDGRGDHGVPGIPWSKKGRARDLVKSQAETERHNREYCSPHAAPGRSALSKLSRLLKDIKEVAGMRGWETLYVPDIELAFKDVTKTIRRSMPSMICPDCEGEEVRRASCVRCHQSGMLSGGEAILHDEAKRLVGRQEEL